MTEQKLFFVVCCDSGAVTINVTADERVQAAPVEHTKDTHTKGCLNILILPPQGGVHAFSHSRSSHQQPDLSCILLTSLMCS